LLGGDTSIATTSETAVLCLSTLNSKTPIGFSTLLAFYFKLIVLLDGDTSIAATSETATLYLSTLNSGI
jgi:hypothetical protein